MRYFATSFAYSLIILFLCGVHLVKLSFCEACILSTATTLSLGLLGYWLDSLQISTRKETK